MDAHDLEKLLAQKHGDDIFIPQCKTRETPCLILDAWASNKSWANFCTYGYEIKVSRNDFLRDEKWRGYLDYCHKFYFVAPPGIINPTELPDNVGFLEASKNAKLLYTKKKAPHRDIVIPNSIYQYILMWRAYTKPEDSPNKAEKWRRWLEQKKEFKEIGYDVARKVREHINSVERENNKLKEQNRTLESIKNLLTEIGINPESDVWQIEYLSKQKLRSFSETEKSQTVEGLSTIARHVDNLISSLQKSSF